MSILCYHGDQLKSIVHVDGGMIRIAEIKKLQYVCVWGGVWVGGRAHALFVPLSTNHPSVSFMKKTTLSTCGCLMQSRTMGCSQDGKHWPNFLGCLDSWEE